MCKKEDPADSQRAGPLWATEATSHLRSHRRPCPGRATWLHEQCPPAPLLQRRVTGGLTAQSGGPVVRGWILGLEVKGERISNLPRGGAQASGQHLLLEGCSHQGKPCKRTVFHTHTSVQVQDLESPGAPLAVMEKRSSWKPSLASGELVPCLLPTVCAGAADGNGIGFGLNLTLRHYSRILEFDRHTLGMWHISMIPHPRQSFQSEEAFTPTLRVILASSFWDLLHPQRGFLRAQSLNVSGIFQVCEPC